MLPESCSGQLSSIPRRARGTVLSCANKHVGVPSCRAPPAQPPRRAPPDPTSPWCVRVLVSTGLHMNSIVRASEETFRKVVFDALGDERVACFLGGQTRRRPVRPGPARPPGRAPPCRDPPVVCPGFGFDRYIGFPLFVSQTNRLRVSCSMPWKP